MNIEQFSAIKMHLRSSKWNKTMIRIYGKFSSKSSVGKTKALRKCRKRFLHGYVWHLSVQPCEKPLYTINTNWRWKRWMHSSKMTKAKRVKFNRIECGMEFVSVIRLPLVCVCVVCVNSYYLFINIYTSHLSRQHVHMRMTSKNHIPLKCREQIDIQGRKRIQVRWAELLNALESILWVINRRFFSSSSFPSSSLFPFSQRSHHQKLKWKHLIEKREINSNNYFYWDASLFTSWITHTHTLSLSNARILPSLPSYTHWVCTNRRVHSKMISKYNWSLLFFFRSFFFSITNIKL